MCATNIAGRQRTAAAKLTGLSESTTTVVHVRVKLKGVVEECDAVIVATTCESNTGLTERQREREEALE